MDGFLGYPLIIFLAAMPSCGWMFMYRSLDHRDPEPLKPTVLGFILGLISTLPVFGLQYFFESFPNFNVVSLMQQNIENTFLFSLLFLIFVGVIEEGVKGIAFLTVIKRQEKHFNQVVDGIIYGALIGLGFALAENIYYFYNASKVFQYTGHFWAVFAVRSFGTMLAHTLFTGVFGFYFAKAYFAPFIEEESKQEKLWHNVRKNLKEAIKLHATFFHLMPSWRDQTLSFRRNAMIFEGYFIAIFLHFLYNMFIKIELFGTNWTFLIVPFMFILAWYAWGQFFIPLFTRILDFVKNKKGLYHLKIH